MSHTVKCHISPSPRLHNSQSYKHQQRQTILPPGPPWCISKRFPQSNPSRRARVMHIPGAGAHYKRELSLESHLVFSPLNKMRANSTFYSTKDLFWFFWFFCFFAFCFGLQGHLKHDFSIRKNWHSRKMGPVYPVAFHISPPPPRMAIYKTLCLRPRL